MNVATPAYRVFPYRYFRFIGAESAEFFSNSDGIVIQTQKGREYSLDLSVPIAETSLQLGWLSAKLVLHTLQGRKVLRGLCKEDAKSAFVWLRAQWLMQIAPEVNRVAAHVQELLANGYPRHSRVELLKSQAQSCAKRFSVGAEIIVPEASWCEAIDISSFKLVSTIAQWNQNDIQQLREQYVEDQLTHYAELFNQVESKPLTACQREACVVDEDNNLVLAGAGSGKTSVMVGRAGYLIQSGQAQPHEILMLAFANKAAAEMQERIDHRLGNCGITATTFHKLGKDIIAQVEGEQPSIIPLAEDEKALANQVNQWFEQHLKTPDYYNLVMAYFQYYLYPSANPFDFETEGEYFDYILANEIRTLKGEVVKSLGECLVANYFFQNGIAYQYEARYEHPTQSVFHRQYQPDFYLPEYGIYVEYYGVDRQGNTAPYINCDEYHQGMQWKRDLHNQHETPLLELFHYEWQEGILFSAIDEKLQVLAEKINKKIDAQTSKETHEDANGKAVKPTEIQIQYQPLSPEQYFEALRTFGAISQLAQLLAGLLKRYRANCYEAGQIEEVIAQAKEPEQVAAMFKLLSPILEDYQSLLSQQKQIDFDDMIGKAVDYVKSGRFKSAWRYILVDEFQDISDARARLVRYLKNSAPECSLFCVGDDWQAIYRFTGSDLSITTNFEQQFGATRVTALDLTFRFNNSISNIASRFVLENPKQIRKELNTLQQVSAPAVSLLRSDNRNEYERLIKVFTAISHIAKQGSSVYLLGRYGFNLPSGEMLRDLKNSFPSLKITTHTIHASKGMEADYVVLMGLETGKLGFPSMKVTHPLLEALLPPLEEFKYAEERRLFYVALTRAKHRVYLVADMAVASDFVVELLNNDYAIELNEFDTSLAQQIFHLMKCTKCKTGTMVPRQSHLGAFFGCNHYPLCDHKERGCSQCSGPMQRVDRFKLCLNAECKNWIPTCPQCGAEMVQRIGRFGEFWGCRNYRKEGDSCQHTENEIIFEH